MERDNAIHQREIAIEQKKQALANFLVSEARNAVNTNPTLALRLLEQSMRYHNNNSIKQAALNIYFNNNFYKSVNNSEISQQRLNQSISNTKLYLHPSNPVPSGNELPYLADSANQKKVEIKLHFRSDYNLNISPDNSHLIAFSKEGEIKIRRIKGKKIEDLKIDSIIDFNIKTNSIIHDVQLLMDKKIILVTEDYATVVKIFNLEGKHIQDLIGHDHPIQSVFAIDENTIYTSSFGYYRTEYYSTRKWSIGNTVINDFEGAKPIVNSNFAGLSHDMHIDGKTFSPDRRTYLQNNWNDLDYAMRVSLRNLQGQVLNDFFVATELITAASFSPGGHYIFIGLNNGTVKMYYHKGLLLRTFDVSNQKKIIAFAFTPDKKKVLICTEDDKCKFWEMPLPLEAFLKSDKIEPLSVEQKKTYSIE
jgi:WD40 repeat protein